MTLLGFHIKHKLFKGKADLEALDNSFAQLIDANFQVLRGSVPKTKAADKLYPEWKNEEFGELDQTGQSDQRPRCDRRDLLSETWRARGLMRRKDHQVVESPNRERPWES